MDRETFEFTKIANAKLIFSNEQVLGHHIWNDPHIISFGDRFCSDAFAEAAIAANFSGLGFAQHEAV